jgi:HSP20 family protein
MNSIQRWNPSGALSLRDAMNRLMEDSFVWGLPGWNGGTRTAQLPLDAYVTDDEIVVQVAVPGVSPDDVEITFEGNTLTVKGEVAGYEEDRNYLFAERFHGQFSRTLRIDIPVDADKIEAAFDNGLLTVTLPKAEAVKPRAIKVATKK